MQYAHQKVAARDRATIPPRDPVFFRTHVRDCGGPAAESPNHDHTAAPMPDDFNFGFALGTRTAIKHVHLWDGATRVGV